MIINFSKAVFYCLIIYDNQLKYMLYNHEARYLRFVGFIDVLRCFT